MIYREALPTTTRNDGRIRPLYRGAQVVWYVLGIVEAFLAFRFVLRAVGANPAAGFTSFIYGVTDIFVAPFLAVFRSLRTSASTIEWSTLLAMAVYWILAWAIVKLLVMSKPVSTPEARKKLDDHDAV